MSELPPTQVVALGYTIIGSISDNAQITFHHAIAEDEFDASVNAKIDRIMAFIDRQKSKYEAPGLQKELTEIEDKLLLIDDDVATAEANFQRAKADQEVQVDTFRSSIKKLTEVGYERHKRAGKGGSHVPRGAEAQQIHAAEAGIQSTLEANQRMVAERDQFLANIETNKQRMAARVTYLKGKLAEIDKLVT